MTEPAEYMGPGPSAVDAGVKLWNAPEFERTERLLRRILAFLLDAGSVGLVSAIVVLSVGLKPWAVPIHGALWFLYDWATVERWGRGWGKKLMKVTVTGAAGHIDLRATMLRSAVKVLILLPLFIYNGQKWAAWTSFGLLLVPVMGDKEQRGLADRAAGTLVVWKK